MRALWVKDERGNPTHSFKDRVVAVALAAAARDGLSRCWPARPPATWPTPWPRRPRGRASARWCSSRPTSSRRRSSATAVYGGTLVEVEGSYDDVNRLASELADEREDWAFVNVNVRPYYAEGSKTIGYEIAEQLGWRLPAQVVVPVASGAQLVKIDKAFRELARARPGRGHAVPGVRRAGQRLRAGGRRVPGRS